VWIGDAEVLVVILINLLPHREAARKRRKETFYVALGASALIGGLLSGLVYVYYQAEISSQQSINSVLKQEIARFDSQIKEIAGLQSEITALKARQQAVENLQSDRNMPVYLLMELSRQLPDGVFIVGLKQTGSLVEIRGTAQSQERVSELLRNLAGTSSWLSKPELIEITSGSVAVSARDQRRVANFSMRMTLVAPVADSSKTATGSVTAVVSAARKP
jgi:type IV pilus assembly protein PilN